MRDSTIAMIVLALGDASYALQVLLESHPTVRTATSLVALVAFTTVALFYVRKAIQERRGEKRGQDE